MVRNYYWNYITRGGLIGLTSLSGLTARLQGSYPNATVRVDRAGTNTLATLYVSASGAADPANPFIASDTGFFDFWTAESSVKLTFSGGGLPNIVTIDNVAIGGGSNPGTSVLSAMASSGDGSSGSPWTGWEAALNALPTGSYIFAPSGTYLRTSLITLKRGCILQGGGKDTTYGTIFTSADLGTGFRTAFTLNTSNRANVSVRDCVIVNTNALNTGSGFLETAGSYIDFTNVAISGFRYNLALNQTEISRFIGCDFEFALRAGAWLVDGGDYNLTYADINQSSANTQITNRLLFLDCQFNQGAGVVCLADDGGQSHEIISCNFNGGSYAIRAAGASPLTITRCQFEGQALDTIFLTNTTLNSGTVVGPCGTVIVDTDKVIQTTAGKHAISVDAGGLTTLDIRGGELQPQTGAAVIGCVNINTIGNWLGENPVSLGLGQMFDVLPTRIVDISPKLGLTLANVPLKMVSAAGVLRSGTSSLGAGGTITVNNTSVTATTMIQLSRNTPGGALGNLSAPGASIVPGTSFTINSSSATDTSSVDWVLIEKQ